MPDLACISCGEGSPRGECPASRRPCGHHCDHSWTHDSCCWCKREFGEQNAEAAIWRCDSCSARVAAYEGIETDNQCVCGGTLKPAPDETFDPEPDNDHPY